MSKTKTSKQLKPAPVRVQPVVKRRRPTVRELWAELLDRRLVGGMLANCAFNLSQQRSRLRDRDCEVLKEMKTKWDAIKAV